MQSVRTTANVGDTCLRKALSSFHLIFPAAVRLGFLTAESVSDSSFYPSSRAHRLGTGRGPREGMRPWFAEGSTGHRRLMDRPNRVQEPALRAGPAPEELALSSWQWPVTLRGRWGVGTTSSAHSGAAPPALGSASPPVHHLMFCGCAQWGTLS